MCLADLALDLGAEIPADVLAELDKIAAPWPGRCLLRPRERVVGVCAGPGGWDEGLAALGAQYDALGLDLSGDGCATAERAGH
ncbi:hypothetical protein OG592_41045 (plasmid) [Streptomyces avidinii]|uniref:hypothetical protein n=1 Tax=Streptomyces avidinii TaxID=1895 RepID=UPI002F910367|nr:hypothetical protein OG592_41045 [Streptomyces avidinii]